MEIVSPVMTLPLVEQSSDIDWPEKLNTPPTNAPLTVDWPQMADGPGSPASGRAQPVDRLGCPAASISSIPPVARAKKPGAAGGPAPG